MLKHFKAALSRMWDARSLNPVADLAEELLDAAVVLVALAPASAVLAAGTRVRRAQDHLDDFDEAMVGIGLRASPPPAGEAAVWTAAPTGLAAPFSRALSIPLGVGGRHGALVAFPREEDLPAAAVRCVAAAAERAFADLVRAEEHRSDLVSIMETLDTMERAARIGAWEFDLVRRTLFWSDEVFRIYGLAPGTPPLADESLTYYPEPGRTRLQQALGRTRATGEASDLVLPFTTAAGERRMVRVIATLHATGEGDRLAGVLQDVTVQEQITERLWWTANHDVLTRLPNRGLFADRVRSALQRSARTGGGFALVLVDVDDFKAVNDTLGHPAGDELLRLVAKALTGAVRASDTVARTGGDEFSLLLTDVQTEEELAPLLRRLREALSVRLVHGERTMLVTMSAGAALAPLHARNERDLCAAADVALYRAKDGCVGVPVVFQPQFGQAVQERHRLLGAVREALNEGSIVPWYQPQIDVVSGRIVGVEALARWVAADGVKIAADFVSAISDHEIGARIGAAVVDRAIAEIAALNAPRHNKIALSVNASAGELVRARFLERIGREVSRNSGGGPITVEITEDVILEDTDGTLAERLKAASAAGVRFSLENVGRGDSSLLRVSTLPISEVKIDRRFIAGLRGDAGRRRVVRGIIAVARALDIRVIVEGVETEEEVADIVALGGRVMQGFFYSQAVPLAELERLLEAEDERLDIEAA